MPIEFRCHACQSLLRTPDAVAGREARCPACSAVVPVPQPAAAVGDAPQSDAAPASLRYPVARPVRAPHDPGSTPGVQPIASLPDWLLSQAATAETLPYRPASLGLGELEPPRAVAPFTIRSLVAAGSRRFAEQWTAALAIGFAALLTWIACQSVIVGVATALIAVARAAGDPPLDGLASFLLVATISAATLGSLALAAWLWAGLRRFGIHVARGEPAGAGQLYARAPIGSLGIAFVVLIFPSWVLGGAPVAMGGPAWASWPLAFVLEIVVAGLLGQSISRVVDRRERAQAALGWSFRACRPHWAVLTGLYALLCLTYLLTMALSAGLALVVVVPWAEIVVAEAYLRLLAEESAREPGV